MLIMSDLRVIISTVKKYIVFSKNTGPSDYAHSDKEKLVTPKLSCPPNFISIHLKKKIIILYCTILLSILKK